MLFQCRDNTGNIIRWIVLKQYVHVIPVSFHPADIPMVLNACLKEVLLNVITKIIDEDRPPIFRYQDPMHHQQVLAVPPVLIFIHDASMKY